MFLIENPPCFGFLATSLCHCKISISDKYSLCRDQLFISLIVEELSIKLNGSELIPVIVSRGPVRVIVALFIVIFQPDRASIERVHVVFKGRMSQGSVMSERDSASLSVVAAGACCRVRRRMQCFGFRGNCTLITRHARRSQSWHTLTG